MYVAGYIVTGFLLAGVYAVRWARGRWGRYEQTARAIPFMMQVGMVLGFLTSWPVYRWPAAARSEGADDGDGTSPRGESRRAKRRGGERRRNVAQGTLKSPIAPRPTCQLET
jgi:hypothetical protein